MGDVSKSFGGKELDIRRGRWDCDMLSTMV